MKGGRRQSARAGSFSGEDPFVLELPSFVEARNSAKPSNRPLLQPERKVVKKNYLRLSQGVSAGNLMLMVLA